MKVLSLFSGIGAFEKALTNLGVDYELVGFSEIDKWAIQSYCAIHGVEEGLNLGDVSKIDEDELPNADLVTYGFPCQDISVAGKGKGINEDTRSGLLYEAERIIEHVKPKYAIAENVKNLVGKRFKGDFEELLERLEGYGYNNYWKVLNAKDFDIPQNRERVFIVSIRKDIDDGRFEFPKETGSKPTLKNLLQDEVEEKYYMGSEKVSVLISQLDRQGKLVDTVGDNSKIFQKVGDRGTSNYSVKVISNTIPANPMSDRGQLLLEPKVAVREATKRGYDIASVGDTINMAFPNSKTRRGRVQKELAGTLDTQCNQATLERDYRIRKLTPLECWRLMGFEDEDYWVARRKLEEVFYNGGDRSNSQMYKQAGNSIVVDVLEGIFENLLVGGSNMFLRDDEMVEYYSLGYVVAELDLHPTKKFERVSDGLVLEVEDECLKWKSGHSPLSFQDEWLEIDLALESFGRVLDHYLDGDDIMCVRPNGERILYDANSLNIEEEINLDDVYDSLWVIIVK